MHHSYCSSSGAGGEREEMHCMSDAAVPFLLVVCVSTMLMLMLMMAGRQENNR